MRRAFLSINLPLYRRKFVGLHFSLKKYSMAPRRGLITQLAPTEECADLKKVTEKQFLYFRRS